VSVEARLLKQFTIELEQLLGKHVQAMKVTKSALRAYEQGADRDQLAEYLDSILAWLEGDDGDDPTDEEPGDPQTRPDP